MDLETHAHEMRLLFGDGYGNVASTIAEQFSSGGIAERLLAALENQHEVASLRAQLAAVTAQRDELLAAADQVADALRDIAGAGHLAYLDAFDAAAAACAASQPEQPQARVGIEGCDQFSYGEPSENNTCYGDGHYLCNECKNYRLQEPEEPEQPPIQQPAVAEPTIQSGEFSFLDELPKGPSIGRFSASERAELDELKRKAFKAGEP